jgi:hypothetical protein
VYTGTLNEAQTKVLQWIADGCPAGLMHGYEHRISAAALRTRDLVRVCGHGDAWHAELTPAGRAYLENPPRPEPRRRRRRQPASASDAEVANASATSQRSQIDKPRPLSPTEQMVSDLLAAGGVIRVPRRHAVGAPDFEQRVASARRFGKVPPGKRLRTSYERGELEIRLEDAPPGTDVEEHDVPVPARASKLHPVARQFRDRIEYHEVSRKQLARCARIVDALAREIERRGYGISNVTKTIEGYRGERWSGSRDGHLVVTIRGHVYDLRVSEEKVSLRGDWERERQRRAERRFDPYYSRTRLEPFDKDATGRLMITLDSGYSREGRQATWADRKSWTLEEKLGELLRELEIRAAEDDHRQAERERQAEERRGRWEAAMQGARRSFIEAQRAQALRNQAAAWEEARALRTYLDALEDRYSEARESAEWIVWARRYVDEHLDPLASPPLMPAEPDIRPDDLKPFLGGLSPYGPSGY